MVIGITGGIGTGKSAITKILKAKYDAELLITDDVAKLLMSYGTVCFNNIVEFFSKKILAADGQIDSGKLGFIVFNDKKKLAVLNSYVHPAVFQYNQSEIEKIKKVNPDAIIVVETALPKEARLDELCDEIWAVITQREIRIARLMEKRGYSLEKCESILDKQLSDEEFVKAADFVIYNNGTKEDLENIITEHMAGKNILVNERDYN